MTLLQRLTEKQAEGKKVISIAYVIDAIRAETQYTPRTDTKDNVVVWKSSGK